MSPRDRIEGAIKAAREVAASDGAQALAKRSKGAAGVWSREDEDRLRRGQVRIWNPNRRHDETFAIGVVVTSAERAREDLLRRCDEARGMCGHG